MSLCRALSASGSPPRGLLGAGIQPEMGPAAVERVGPRWRRRDLGHGVVSAQGMYLLICIKGALWTRESALCEGKAPGCVRDISFS